MVRVKICGITSPEDADVAVRAGADAIGFVFAEKSPRKITPERAREIAGTLPPFVSAVGVFVEHSAAAILEVARYARLTAVQVHGDRTPEEIEEIAAAVRVIKAFRVRDRSVYDGVRRSGAASAYLFDAYVEGLDGGTGTTIPADLLPSDETQRSFGKPWILAGGLRPDNVEKALAACRPYAVDVSSGVEARPGKKDEALVREFVARVRGFQHG